MKYLRITITAGLLFRGLALLLVILAVSLTIHEWALMAERDHLYQAAANEALDERLESVGDGLTEVFASAREGLRSLSSVLAVYSGVSDGRAGAEQALRIARDAHPEYYFVRYIGADGSAFVTLSPPGMSVGDETVFDAGFDGLLQDAQNSITGDILVSGLSWYPVIGGTKIPLVYAITPVVAAGKTYGYLEVALDIRNSFTAVTQAQRAEDVLFLLDSEGKYLVAPHGTPVPEDTVTSRYPKEVVDHLYGPDTVGAFTYGDRVFAYEHLRTTGVGMRSGDPEFWVLVSVSDTRSVFSAARRARNESVFSLAVFLLLAGLAGLLVYRLRMMLHTHL
ncbi:MAG: cache domain-containing protein [bacterium]